MAALKITLAQLVGNNGESHIYQDEDGKIHTPNGPVVAKLLKSGDLVCLHAGDRLAIPIASIESV